jgi:hypothetical protein
MKTPNIAEKESLSLREILEGTFGVLGMILAFLTPWLRQFRTRWGLSVKDVRRGYPGDAFIEDPSWQWTHGVVINAPTQEVWPWLLQIGQERGGFYSYRALENLAGCQIKPAESLRAEWRELGSSIRLHPKQAPIPIVAAQPNHWFLAHAQMDLRNGNEPTEETPPEMRAEVSWLFFLEALSDGRSRLISRYRIEHGKARAARLMFGASVMEPIGFVMDRKMLLGIKQRAEGLHQSNHTSWRGSSLGYYIDR